MKVRRSLLASLIALSAFQVVFAEVPDSIKQAIKHADEAVAKIVAIPAGKRTYENTLLALDDLNARLENETSLFVFYANVAPDAATRDQAREADELVSNYGTELGLREDLYKAIKEYADSKPKLSGVQARLLDRVLRDYRQAGMNLPPDKRQQVKDIELQLNKLQIDFNQNIADDESTVMFTKEELAGVPASSFKRFKQSGDLYILGMDNPTYDGVMSNCTVEETRHKYWMAYKRRGGQKNVNLLEKIIKLRDDQARLMGYPNHAEFRLELRMAKNSKTVFDFYKKLQPIVRKKAQQDWDEFLAAKRELTGDKDAQLHQWDQGYIKDHLQKTKYSVDSEKVREYFPMKSVVDGLFQITQSLYGIKYTDVTADHDKLGLPLWQEDVKLYEVSDSKTGKVIGHFYFDVFPRPGKYNHAACWGLQHRKVWSDGTVTLPLAALVTNFTKPTETEPSLMPHEEVTVFFHEFGHCLHNMLSESDISYFSGTQVERDFVEAPSQMFENWTWEPQVLKLFAKNYKTGEPLPDDLLSRMKASRTLGSGLETEHQFYYGLTDMAYYTAPGGKVDTTQVGIDLMNDVELYHGVPGTMYQASFGHLMHYDAGYYGYQWSLVFAQDMFSRFQKLGLLDPKAGAYYREKVLSKGGTKDAWDMLRDYLGREPDYTAYLKYLGFQN
ncbi:MAG: Zn-dependent oligopeptidase [Armatimonadetes bacterium]|nr:Zn-dependent oligopeptidase [Armatimonadota bacterium]